MYSGASNPDPTSERLSVVFETSLAPMLAWTWARRYPPLCLTRPHVKHSKTLLADGIRKAFPQRDWSTNRSFIPPGLLLYEPLGWL
jgi:hypothetical protein